MKRHPVPLAGKAMLLAPLFLLALLLGNGKEANATKTAQDRLAGTRLLPCDWNRKPSFIDPRDQHEYRQVQIGGQCWMASNLYFGKVVPDMQQSANRVAECTCYGNDTANCKRFGGLYSWDEAMGNAKPEPGKEIQGLCPDGWHLPSDAEWTTMEQALDPSIVAVQKDWRGKTLAYQMIATDPAWNPVAAPQAASGFDALPAGSAVSGWFFYLGRGAYFWTASPYSAAAAWSRGLISQTGQVFRGPGDKLTGYSVRCVKNR